jgi:hypothetical protein
MTTQNNVLDYATAIQAQLSNVVNPVPVYANFNRNFATQPKFVTWQLRNVHQPVYTGQVQSVKGIDTPIFQASIFAQQMQDAFGIANTIIQALHGYAGQFGGTGGFDVSKIDVNWLYNTYDDQVKLHQIILDCRMYIPC